MHKLLWHTARATLLLALTLPAPALAAPPPPRSGATVETPDAEPRFATLNTGAGPALAASQAVSETNTLRPTPTRSGPGLPSASNDGERTTPTPASTATPTARAAATAPPPAAVPTQPRVPNAVAAQPVAPNGPAAQPAAPVTTAPVKPAVSSAVETASSDVPQGNVVPVNATPTRVPTASPAPVIAASPSPVVPLPVPVAIEASPAAPAPVPLPVPSGQATAAGAARASALGSPVPRAPSPQPAARPSPGALTDVGREIREGEEPVSSLLAPPPPPAATLPTPPVQASRSVTATSLVTASPTVSTARAVSGTTPVAASASTSTPITGPAADDIASHEDSISLISIPPSALTLPPVGDGPTFVLAVPYRSQLDGTAYQHANCGPASLAMVLEAFGVKLPTSRIRHRSNGLQGTYGYDDGIALDYLAQIGQENGLLPIGLYGQGGGRVFSNYKHWSIGEVREQVLAGHPVITLARYQALPGNRWSAYSGDHYIVITGLFGRNFVYNDAAFVGSIGYARLMSEETLLKVWETSSIPHHAVAFGTSGDALRTVEINQSESARAALLQIAASGEEALDIPMTAAGAGTIRFDERGQLQILRREALRTEDESGERLYGRLDGLVGVLEAGSPTEMRHLGPGTPTAEAAAPKYVDDDGLGPRLDPARPAIASLVEGADAAPANDSTAAPVRVESGANPIHAFFQGVVRWFQNLPNPITMLFARG